MYIHPRPTKAVIQLVEEILQSQVNDEFLVVTNRPPNDFSQYPAVVSVDVNPTESSMRGDGDETWAVFVEVWMMLNDENFPIDDACHDICVDIQNGIVDRLGDTGKVFTIQARTEVDWWIRDVRRNVWRAFASAPSSIHRYGMLLQFELDIHAEPAGG